MALAQQDHYKRKISPERQEYVPGKMNAKIISLVTLFWGYPKKNDICGS